MSMDRINRISPESIEDFDDVRSWARDMNSEVKEIHEDIPKLQNKDTKIEAGVSRSIRLSWYSSVFSAAVLIIVVLLSGLNHIFQMVKGMF